VDWYISDVLEELSASTFRVSTWCYFKRLETSNFALIFNLGIGTEISNSFLSLMKYPLQRTWDGPQNLSGDGNNEETLYCYTE
jgi:hypothetical protein